MNMTNTQRTDPHRPGAICPADYEYQCSYSLPGMDPIIDPGYMDALNQLRSMIQAGDFSWFARWGGHAGQCDVCGANFRHGDVWRHIPSDQFLHIGHECASKYALLANRETWLVWRKAAIKEQRHKKARLIAEEFARQYRADNPAIDAAFKLGEAENAPADFRHNVLRDMAQKLVRFGSLSEKQIEFALKLATEIAEIATSPEEIKVAAPTGRVELTGTVVSVKEHVSDFGVTLKMTVKVTTPEGIWLAWMTVPTSPFFQYCGGQSPFYNANDLKGHTVTVRATLSHGKDQFFAFGKRPTLIAINGKKWEAPAATPIQQTPGDFEISVSIDRNPSTPVYRAYARPVGARLWEECGTEFTSEAALARAAEYVTARGGTVKQ